MPKLMELLESEPSAPIGREIWKKVCPFLGKKVERLDLRISAERKIIGLPPQALADWFRQYCDSHGGSGVNAYSPRHRQNIRLIFEEVRRRWEHVVDRPLHAVKNYPRSPRRGFIDLQGARRFQKGDLDRMRSLFISSIGRDGIFPRSSAFASIGMTLADESAAIKFFNLVFSLIVNTGISFPGCFSCLCRLRRKHVPSEAQGEWIIPRNSTGKLWLSVTPDDISRIAMIALVCHVSRVPKSQGIRRRQLHPLAGEEYLLGEEPTRETIRKLRAGFNQWLHYLARKAGAYENISLDTLLQAAQIRLPEMYSAEVIASLTGKIRYHPLPPDQVALGMGDPQAFHKDIEIPNWGADRQPSREKDSSLSTTDEAEDREPVDHEETEKAFSPFSLDDDLVQSFFDVCQPYVLGSATSGQAAKALLEWGKTLLGAGQRDEPLPEWIKRNHQQLFQSNPTINFPLWNSVNVPLVQRWNFACVAGWLAWRLTHSGYGRKTIRNPHTFQGYRRDILSLLRAYPQVALSEMGDDEMEEYFSNSRTAEYAWTPRNAEDAPSFRTGTISCWRSLRQYLSREAGIPLAPASLAAKSDSRKTHYTRLVSAEEVHALLRICALRGTREAYCCYLAILLAYHSGLRAIEIVRLRLSQIVVRGMPTIFVRRGKRKKPRSVLLDDAPEAFVRIIKQARERRWRETRDLSSPLLAFPPSQAGGGPESESVRAKKLSRWVRDILNQGGLRSRTLTGDPPDLHRLRHAYINRSFLIRVDRMEKAIRGRFGRSAGDPGPRGIDYVNNLRQISVNAGHATYQVTLEQYMHGFNMLQQAQLTRYQAECDAVSDESIWLGRRAFEEILSLDHAQAHQILRGSGGCTWRRQGERRMLGIGLGDALCALGDEISGEHIC